jgi:hypothetical protein
MYSGASLRMNAERIAVAEAAMTATHASSSTQSNCQVASKPFSPGEIPPRMRIKARMIMKAEVDRKNLIHIFWRLSMSDFRRMSMGNEITDEC